MHATEKMYVPELIFGTLLTSSNYDDDQKKVTGGRNGYGAKLCNIFSTEFSVETACKESGKTFKQVGLLKLFWFYQSSVCKLCLFVRRGKTTWEQRAKLASLLAIQITPRCLLHSYKKLLPLHKSSGGTQIWLYVSCAGVIQA